MCYYLCSIAMRSAMHYHLRCAALVAMCCAALRYYLHCAALRYTVTCVMLRAALRYNLHFAAQRSEAQIVAQNSTTLRKRLCSAAQRR